MSDKQFIQPNDTFESQRFGFTQVVTSPPGKLVFVSGQVALDRDLKLVGGGDVAAQALGEHPKPAKHDHLKTGHRARSRPGH